MKKIVGILGGMGPGATADAFLKLINRSPANKDQEHIPVIIASLPNIPDRTENIVHNGPSPLPEILNSLRLLENSGASCIIMPCNTAHFWYDEIKKNTSLEFINIIDVTCKSISVEPNDNVLILATTATIKTELYQKRLMDEGINCIIPDEENQRKIMESIISYKSGQHVLAYNIIRGYLEEMKEKGIKKIIMGCTEIPLILKELTNSNPGFFIDATQELINATVDWYYDSDTIKINH